MNKMNAPEDLILEELERSAMFKLLEGEDPRLKLLLHQYELASVKNRELTSYGFFTSFAVPDNVEPIETKPSFKIGDVRAQIAGLR